MATNGNPPKRHFNEDILGFLHALSRLSLSYPFCNSKFVRCNSWGRSDFVTRSDKKNGFQISDREKLGMNIAPLRCGICRNIYTVECIYIYCIYIYVCTPSSSQQSSDALAVCSWLLYSISINFVSGNRMESSHFGEKQHILTSGLKIKGMTKYEKII